MRPKECDIILGSDCFFEILRSGKIVGSKKEPIAQRTMFGSVVAGKLNVKNKEPNELYSHFLSTENDLKTDSLLQRNWKPYIANRTSEILDLVPVDSWRYVLTKMNPADIACRGLSPKERPRCGLWWEGPQWLSCGMDSWPKQSKRDDQTSLVTKERKRTAFSFPVSVNCDFIDSLFLKFSSFSKIIDIFAFCFRYITNCKARVGKMKSNLDFKANKAVASKSILSALCPFIDKDGLIRVGGRLRNSTLQYSAKHPIILPNQHEICNLIVNMYRATTSKQLMGDLPAHRVTPSKPFSACGVDYAGPINVLRYRGRGARTIKGYSPVCMFRYQSSTFGTSE
ncbi:uncharacterized protein TNCT_481091 [Trichonephila clavata]|uniref:Uncharacterized protein n=1 Tax=Trichonephila clavata TaxID=2740835 RepID=A0A8X6KXQ2_TRICU|nr:uncharacterized protein TNCT_481091 [Trichonephila clavata]